MSHQTLSPIVLGSKPMQTQSFPRRREPSLFSKLFGKEAKRKKRARKRKSLKRSLLEAGLVAGTLATLPLSGGAGLISGVGARVLARRVAISVGKKAVSTVAKRPITTIVVGGILTASPTARKAVVSAPKNLFLGGKTIGKGIEGLTPEQKEKGGKFGLPGLLATTLGVGLIATGVFVGAKKIKEKIVSAKSLVPVTAPPVSAGAVIKPTTEAITTPLVSLDEPKPPLLEKPTQPRRAKITQNVNINVRQSQNRKFINQLNY